MKLRKSRRTLCATRRADTIVGTMCRINYLALAPGRGGGYAYRTGYGYGTPRVRAPFSAHVTGGAAYVCICVRVFSKSD